MTITYIIGYNQSGGPQAIADAHARAQDIIARAKSFMNGVPVITYGLSPFGDNVLVNSITPNTDTNKLITDVYRLYM